jgi:hypothetical protein
MKTGTDASPSEFPPQSVLICRRLAKKARHIGTYALTAALVGSSCPTSHQERQASQKSQHQLSATCNWQHSLQHCNWTLDTGHETRDTRECQLGRDPSSMTGAVDNICKNTHFLNFKKDGSTIHLASTNFDRRKST